MKTENKENTKVSRGYAGFFGEWYLRSLLEYKVALYVKYLEGKFNISAKYEPNYLTFCIFGKKYKPDFYLYRNNKIYMIIEVKPDKKSADKYIEQYYTFFKDKDIKYRVIYSSSHFNKISKKCGITDKDTNEWKKNSIYDYSGKNNPAFGLKWTKETKAKIGAKTKERCADEDYMTKFKKAITNGMTETVRQKIRNARLNSSAIKRRQLDVDHPITTYTCYNCSNIYLKRDISDMNFITFGFRSCSKGCTQKLKLANGILTKLNKKWNIDEKRDRFKIVLLNQGNTIYKSYSEITEDVIKIARKNGIIHKNSQLSIKSISKYFGNVDDFIKEIVDGKFRN